MRHTIHDIYISHKSCLIFFIISILHIYVLQYFIDSDAKLLGSFVNLGIINIYCL